MKWFSNVNYKRTNGEIRDTIDNINFLEKEPHLMYNIIMHLHNIEFFDLKKTLIVFYLSLL